MFQVVLILATLLCSLTAGLVFGFAVVVMPGIKTLDDREFIRAFQVVDGVIQNNQPLFMLAWVGSVVALALAVVLGFGQTAGSDRLLLILAASIYVVGVQLPTVTINVPLNNTLQAVDVDQVDDAARRAARQAFEPRWNRWNAIRTGLATLTVVLLLTLLTRL